MASGTLYLIPVPLGETPSESVIPSYNTGIINSITEFIVEDVRTARRHLKIMGMKTQIDTLLFHELGKHSDELQYESYLDALSQGKDIGLLSDAGCPGVADPGAAIIRIAHRKNFRVVPLTGPSSLLLALMASGSNGQQFVFHGYLPKERPERIRKIKELERNALALNQSQLFIETPFRNDHVLEDLLGTCKNDTLLCIACDITLSSEFIQTRRISDWKMRKPALHKRPAVFIICT
ncbi:MAG TPA: SAM-dependent methyltransferase [Bacteroidia bacterium]|jgi:16S rRNA (cytidine1402-2'-O)-methyltransferase|nr:SAM-dependent methyltransferase [Bacteroidia bacterium]